MASAIVSGMEAMLPMPGRKEAIMFENAMFVPERHFGMRATVLPIAALAHAALAALLVVIPLMRTGDLPAVELTGVFVAPALPAPPPPPPASKGRRSAPGNRIKRPAPVGGGGAMTLVAPVEIPKSITEEALDGGGEDLGIPGGADYGAGNGVPWNAMGIELFRPMGEEAGPVRPIGEVKMPRLIKRVEPEYPELARLSRNEGIVILEATTDIFGRVVDVRVLKSLPLIDEAAIAAVRQWIYEPMIVNGRPRGLVVTVTLRFELKK